MKVYWVTMGAGLLAAVFGVVAYTVSDHEFGVILVLGGLVVCVMGAAMRLAEVYIGDKRSK
ncbi:MAG: hypothetical protein P4L93_02665 [Coriobacteriia bacterium]|nr:hypothetical protein [Coriobacteriia bacterium]